MGRGKVQLKLIENKINRQVTFSKRKAGLLKKAHEISVLCDAEVALIVFSHKGKVFEYATDSCMEKILEQYERDSYAGRQPISTECEIQGNWTVEYSRLKARVELLQRNYRHYLGEDLDSLSVKEIRNLEQTLDTSLKQIRSRKNQIICGSISALQIKKKAIQEENNFLAKRIKQEKTLAQQAQCEQQNYGSNPSPFLMPHPLPCLNIGGSYQQEGSDRMRSSELDLTLEPFY